MKKLNPFKTETREIEKFVWVPSMINGRLRWLCTVKIKQIRTEKLIYNIFSFPERYTRTWGDWKNVK